MASAAFQNRIHISLDKAYLVYTVFAGAILFTTYFHIFENYAFLDDYYLFYHYNDQDFLLKFNGTGRPLYGIIMKYLGAQLYYISDFKYVRMISLIGIISFSLLVYRAYLSSGWTKFIASCAAIVTCLMPAFGIYAAWTTCFAIIYGFIAAFVAGETCIVSFEIISTKGSKIKALIMVLLSFILIIISLMIYQPIATGFWLFVAINIFMPLKNKEKFFSKTLYSFCLYTFSVLIYFIWYKAAIWPFAMDVFQRSSLIKSPLIKTIWFLKSPFYDSLSLITILQDNTIISITVILVSILILTGISLRITRNKANKFKFLIILIGLIPLSYLPNLVSNENWSAFRTQGVLGSLILFYFLLFLVEIFRGKSANIVFTFLTVGFMVVAYSNVTYGIVIPQRQEIQLIRSALKEKLFKKPKEIIFIQSNWKDSLAPKSRYDEYGLPSTSAPWVPECLINLLVREYKKAAFLPIKVYNFKHDYKVSPKEEIAIINAGELLQEYKQTVPKNKFCVSNDIRLMINNTNGFGDIKPLNQLSFQYRSDGMVLSSHGHDPYFALPLFNFPSEKDLVVKIDITSPKDTVLQLYYATKSVPNYSEKQSIRRRIAKGSNIIFIQLPPKDYTGNFRLDPGKIVGEFLLHSIEIRGVSKG